MLKEAASSRALVVSGTPHWLDGFDSIESSILEFISLRLPASLLRLFLLVIMWCNLGWSKQTTLTVPQVELKPIKAVIIAVAHGADWLITPTNTAVVNMVLDASVCVPPGDGLGDMRALIA